MFAGEVLLNSYVALAIEVGLDLPLPGVALALSGGLWVPGIALSGTFLILLFPDGHLPSPRWRPFAWGCGAVLLLVWAHATLAPGPFRDLGYPQVENPIGLELLRGNVQRLDGLTFLMPVVVIGSAVGLIVRFRRSRGQERLQLQWLTAAAGGVAVIALATVLATFPEELSDGPDPFWVQWMQQAELLSLALIPLAIGTAILRHRLYDIDVIVNRALVYASLSGVLVLVYLGAVVLIQQVLSPITADSDIAIAGSTLAVAALFRPLRGRVQAFIDRRFYRHKYDAAETLSHFAAGLRNEVDLDAVTRELMRVAQVTVQPAHASLWLRASGETR